jgi:hypothetical protein
MTGKKAAMTARGAGMAGTGDMTVDQPIPPDTRPAHGLTAAQLAALRSALAPHADRIERVDLFGSRATGRARPNSAVDLVIRGDIDEALTRIMHQRPEVPALAL